MLELLYDDMEVKTYGDRIRKERMVLGMTQKEYADKYNISYRRLVKLENKKHYRNKSYSVKY